MRFGSKMRGALVPAHETMCCSAIRGASRRMSVLRGLQILDLSLRRTVRKLAARQAMRFTSAWVWKAIGSGKGICRSLLQRASSADRLLDFLRLRVRAGVEGAVGRVFGSAALTISCIRFNDAMSAGSKLAMYAPFLGQFPTSFVDVFLRLHPGSSSPISPRRYRLCCLLSSSETDE